MLIDTHAHYDDEKYDTDRYELLSKIEKEMIVVNVGTDLETSKKSISYAEKYRNVFAVCGIHPHCVGEANKNDLDEIIKMLSYEKVVAIGEIGLDYYYDFAPKELQIEWLKLQIDIAKEYKMPFVVHDRDAHEDILRILKDKGPYFEGAIMHSYSGSVEMAKELLKLGFTFSFSGTVTFKNAKKVLEVIKYLPNDKIIIETDSPYLTPEPYRGKRNDSSKIEYIAKKISEIKEMNLDEMENVLYKNSLNILQKIKSFNI